MILYFCFFDWNQPKNERKQCSVHYTMVSVGHIRGHPGVRAHNWHKMAELQRASTLHALRFRLCDLAKWFRTWMMGWRELQHNAVQCPPLACQGITPVNHLHSSTQTKFIIHPACIWTGLAGKTTIVNSFALILLFEKIYGLGSFRRKPKQNNRNVDKKNKRLVILPYFPPF